METPDQNEQQENAAETAANDKITNIDVSNHLTIFGRTETDLKKFKDECKGLTIAGVNDTDGYNAVSAKIKEAVKWRTSTETKRKFLNKKINEAGTKLLAEVAPIEADLKAKKQVIDDEKDKLQKQADELALIKFNDRTKKLFEIGVTFSGEVYIIGAVSLSTEIVKTMSDADFELTVARCHEIANKLKEDAAIAAAKEEALTAKEKELAEREAALNERIKKLDIAEFEKEQQMIKQTESTGPVVEAVVNTNAPSATEEEANKINAGLSDLAKDGVIQSGQVTGFDDKKETVNISFTPNIPADNVNLSGSTLLDKSKTWTPNVVVTEATTQSINEQSEAAKKVIESSTPEERIEALIALSIERGFENCKSQVLAIINSNAPITRKILNESINALNPTV
jgi:hypothetical protein